MAYDPRSKIALPGQPERQRPTSNVVDHPKFGPIPMAHVVDMDGNLVMALVDAIAEKVIEKVAKELKPNRASRRKA